MNKKYFNYLSLLFFIVTFFGISSTAYSQCVVTNGNDMGAGSLRDCIENSGEAIVNIDPSVDMITLAGEIIFDSTITVNGNNATVDGDGVGRIFSTINDGSGPFDIELNDLMLTGGNGAGATFDGDGGAIFNAGHNFTINRCNIFSNTASGIGGGIYSDDGMAGAGSLTINQSTIDNNLADFNGGGLAFRGTTIGTINDSTISNNLGSDNGGGLFMDGDSVVTITNSTICDNETPDSGGGARVTGAGSATLNLIHVTVADNEADTDSNGATDGGGLSIGGSVSVNTTNVLIIGNTSDGSLNNCDAMVDMNTGDSSSDDTTCYTRSPNADPTNVFPLADNGGLTLTKDVLSNSNIATAAAGNCEATDQRGFDRVAPCTPGAVEAVDTGTISITKESLDNPPPTDFTSTNFPDGCELQSPFTLNEGETNSCIVPVDATEYTVTEIVPAGFELAISCTEIGSPTSTDDTNNPTVNIEIMAEGDEVDCVFTNSDIDECTSDPCQNGGMCMNEVGGFTCDCTGTGFEGDICDMDVDDCTPDPCMNGGVCTDEGTNAFSCDCAGTGFEGDICDMDVDDCTPDPCLNGGVCTDEGTNAFSCDCTGTGFEGDTCETEIPDLIEIGDESTDDDGVRFSVDVDPGVPDGGTIEIDSPPGVKVLSANSIPGGVANCTVVDPDASTNLVDVDVICDVNDFPNEFDIDLGLCREDDDDEGIANLQVKITPDSIEESFQEIVEILLNALDGCDGDGGGCSIASSNTNITSGISNLLVMLLPAIVGIGGIFFRRRKQGA